MRRCCNPNCSSTISYGDDTMVCPLCGSPLDGTRSRDKNSKQFMQRFLCRFKCEGRLTEIESKDLFLSKWHKLINLLIRNEDYQFAHQSSVYVLRVEDLCGSQARTIYLFGNWMGLRTGDQIIAKGKYRLLTGRDVATVVYNVTTHERVRPDIQISGRLIKWLLYPALVTLGILIIGGVSSASAGYTNLASFLFLICAGLIWSFWSAIKMVLKFLRRK